MTKKQRRSFLRNLKKGQVDVNKHEHLEQAHKVIQLIQDYTVPTVSNPLKALTKAQSAYIKSIKNNLITFGFGPPGTGKTFV